MLTTGTQNLPEPLEFLDHIAVVGDVHSTCGRVSRQGAQAAVADLGFTPHREIADRRAQPVWLVLRSRP